MTSIKLKHPITVDGHEVDTVNLRRPTVRDLLAIDKVSGTIAISVKMISNLAELTPEQVQTIDAQDFAAITRTFEDFLSPDQQSSEG